METLLIDIIRSGSIAFVGSKIVKAFGEKEISEIIAGTGWLIIGVDTLLILTPIIKGIQNFFDKASNTLNSLSNTFEKLTHLPVVGDLVKRGLIEVGSNVTGN